MSGPDQSLSYNQRMRKQMQELLATRDWERQLHLAESMQLVLELGTLDPLVQQCCQVLQSTSLSQDINVVIEGEDCSPQFKEFINNHYKQACLEAIQAVYIYGFIPWRIRTLKDGNKVPEVLPAGTFTWGVVSNRSEAINHVDTSRLLRYEVRCKDVDLKDTSVYVFNFTEPTLNVASSSNIYASICSPMAHIIPEYKAFREAQIRRSHADKWNTTARIVTGYNPSRSATDNPQFNLLQSAEAGAKSDGAVLPLFNMWQNRDTQIEDQMAKPSNHTPLVYNMPRDVATQQLPDLKPCEDLIFLQERFNRSVTSVFGIPADLLHGRSARGNDLTARVQLSGRIFSANIQRLCMKLQEFMRDCYCQIYNAKSTSVKFELTPIPRLDVESIQDLKILHEIGLLTPDASANISNMLLGVDPTGVVTKDSGDSVKRQFGQKQFGAQPQAQPQAPPKAQPKAQPKTQPKAEPDVEPKAKKSKSS